MRRLRRSGDGVAVTADIQDAKEPYAILSHTWLADDEEVLYHELNDHDVRNKLGYRKIEFLLQQTEREGMRDAWMDTCCIDKRNNNELTEALNSMFRWYAHAAVCFVYLEDVPRVSFQKSRWFTRGWTLQELLAPKLLKFFDGNGRYLGDGTDLSTMLKVVTDIDRPLRDIPLLQRFQLSMKRTTKKPEDLSYCMIGLMEVNLMLNYGEGKEKAIERLVSAIEEEHGKKVAREILKLRITDAATTQDTTQDNVERLLDSLAFDEMFSRAETIDEPYPRTCSWFIDHPDYQRWLKQDFRFLWIKAKAGAGKSTLMKYIASTHASPVCYFFNARGALLERSTTGMYRSLLWHLGRKHSLPDMVITRDHTWTVRNLQSLLRRVILDLETPQLFFVDALDECPETDVQDMVYMFHTLSELSSNFFVCFASRYYPGILIKDSIELRLDLHGEHAEDIEKYVNGRMDAEQHFKDQVIRKANGIFLWVILVVPILNREISSGNVHELQARLDELPPDIHRLLGDLAKDPDDQFILSMQVLISAISPLTPGDFYVAVMVGLGKEHVYKEWAAIGLSPVMLERFIATATRGLAEITNDSTTIQFIHESVRDFLLQHGGLDSLAASRDRQEVMAQVCYDYIMKLIVTDAYLHNPDGDWAFLDYALDNCLLHAAETPEVSRDGLLRRIQPSKLVNLIKDLRLTESIDVWYLNQTDFTILKLIIYQSCSTMLSGTSPLMDGLFLQTIRLGFNPGPEDVAYAMRKRKHGVVALLAAHLQVVDGLRTSVDDADAACLTWPLERIKKRDTQLKTKVCSTQTELEEPVWYTPLQDMETEIGRLESIRRAVLYWAVMEQDLELVQEMLSVGVHPDIRDIRGRTPLMIVSEDFSFSDRNDAILQALLDHGADLNLADWNGETAQARLMKRTGRERGFGSTWVGRTIMLRSE